jgi:nucleotide-binding universal stress UspA family protein
MFKTILVAYDGSDHAQQAVSIAGDLAASEGAVVHLVTVVDHDRAPESVTAFAEAEHVDNPERLEAHAYEEQMLRPVAKQLEGAGVENVRCEVLRGDAATALIDYAKAANADLIVTGRRGQGRLEGLLVGSVSAKLTSHADCAVLTVK